MMFEFEIGVRLGSGSGISYSEEPAGVWGSQIHSHVPPILHRARELATAEKCGKKRRTCTNVTWCTHGAVLIMNGQRALKQ